jgi:hypothetical protein
MALHLSRFTTRVQLLLFLSNYRSIARNLAESGLYDGLFPFHSPLLGESNFLSFPPLTNMLKFSGLAYLM